MDKYKLNKYLSKLKSTDRNSSKYQKYLAKLNQYGGNLPPNTPPPNVSQEIIKILKELDDVLQKPEIQEIIPLLTQFKPHQMVALSELITLIEKLEKTHHVSAEEDHIEMSGTHTPQEFKELSVLPAILTYLAKHSDDAKPGHHINPQPADINGIMTSILQILPKLGQNLQIFINNPLHKKIFTEAAGQFGPAGKTVGMLVTHLSQQTTTNTKPTPLKK